MASGPFYVIVTTPPKGVQIVSKHATHTDAARAREVVAKKLKSGTAHVKGHKTLLRTGVL
jgi:hypothetical protein